MLCKWFGKDDIVEHLYHEDTTFVRFFRKERKHLFILLERLFVYFQRKRIIFQFDQRCKRMTIPEIQGIHAVGYQHIEIFNPLFLIIKPRETFRSIRILIHTVSRQVSHLLQTDTSAAEHHFRTIFQLFRKVKLAIRVVHTVYQFATSVDHSASVSAAYSCQIAGSRNMKAFFLKRRIIHFRQQNRLYFRIGECGIPLLHHYLITGFIQGSL